MGLLEIMHELAHKAPNGRSLDTIASIIGRNYWTLSSELNVEVDRHKLGADLILPLMEAADSDEPLHFLSRARNGVFVRLPGASGVAPTFKASLDIADEFGAAMAALSSAMDERSENGEKISDDEMRKLSARAHRLQTATAVWLEAIKREFLDNGGDPRVLEGR